MEPHKFCHYCGTAYDFGLKAEDHEPRDLEMLKKLAKVKWPRTCGACSETVWRNPLPVVVCLVRAIGSGLFTIRRNIEPACGELAFPGGYMDVGETWQQAAARELFEESSELLDVAPDHFELIGLAKAGSTDSLLIFCGCPKLIFNPDLDKFQPNAEVSELKVIREPTELAWSTHTEVAKRYFEGGMAWPTSL